jgi:hypothetical membrane protein
LQKHKIAAAAGIITPVLAFTCILLAIASYSKFSWTNNALSDLGVIPGLTSLVFNFGLCASGILALFFSVFSLFPYLRKSWAGKIGVAIFSTATIALVAIGIFNESYSGTHTAVSVAFFVLMPISLLVITSAFLLEKRMKMAILTAVIATAAATPWIMLFEFSYFSGVAIPEAASGLAVSAWTIIVSYRIIKQAKN